ncbi:MAG: prepilin-type N-terminal cleavage/methylation domain-containing protein [Candidatus Hydrogenedentota bacterium]|jgi:prepilin-type N-terminal cleavage/methylation domain-containing protein|uniref:Putative secretion system X protein GspG-like 3 n=1 Tax=Sumerlaea chitinivorans TaxID=2250252 RepID=A0A2Z4Y5J7_SUMC1|nr:putative secretion system X protein GspG-like 3 [Candidatus Sumerlaea chitinivorans]MCX7964669.1 prepilin-type N-terminal cleavage/methylation domain-containing protein [Candidatus Sumerlaea chitinivorans]RMH29764.1 MAG: prepilin-type N-terminal cleavage/methylation domain-containing protein [Candidatus Hydrogenedentota bacterium]GIX45582.1 MAG: hypothetical protein KatS3mg130_1990 [Candidatus Sumerlaea sp.]
MSRTSEKAFTLVELLAVVLILGILASISVGVYTTQVERARIAAARAMISEIEIAVNRYQIDTGQYPPSGSGSGSFPAASPAAGCGYLQLALTHGLGNTSGTLWHGPYLTIKREMLGDINGTPLEVLGGSISPGEVQILDPWRSPYRYVRSGPAPDDYATMKGTRLPSGHPYALTDVYYNPSTFQISSRGPNGSPADWQDVGSDADDITNFGI